MNYNKQSTKHPVNTTYNGNSSSYWIGGYRLGLNILFYDNSSLLCFQPIQPTNNPSPQYILWIYSLHYMLCWKIIYYLLDLVPENTTGINPLNPELNPICDLLALLGAHHFLHLSRIRVKSLTFRRLMSYIYGAPILDVSRSHTTTHHSR